MSIESAGLTDRQRRALAVMGIDVWVRRDAPAAGAADIGAAPSITAATPKTTMPEAAPIAIVRPPERSKAAVPELKINLDCIAAPSVVAVGECVSPLDRQLAKDIVLAVAGVASQVQKSQFRWPQTQTGDASEFAARNAYRGFLRGQVERANARLLMLFGASAERLLDQEMQLGPETLRLTDLRTLRADPNGKRQLWLSVSPRIRA
jgi:hypothetical protein